jgi:hypothetical protein
MQIAIIITPVRLGPQDMRAGSICMSLRSIKSPQTENMERELGPEQPANPQTLRLAGPCRRPAGRPLPNHDDCQKWTRIVDTDTLLSMQTLLFCPSYWLSAL